MKLPRRGRPGPIGIDLSGRALKAVQLSRRAGAWRLEAAAEVPRRAGSDLAAEALRLAGVLERQGFVGREVALAVPDSALLTAVLEVPPRSSGAPVAQIALAEMAHIHRRDPTTLELACWELPSPPRGAEHAQAMAVACAHDDAGPLLDAFGQAGFEVRALDARAVAIARACRALWSPPPSLTVVLDLGWESALLAVGGGGVVMYERLLEACELRRLHAALVEREGLPAALADHLLMGGPPGAGRGGTPETAAAAQRHIENHAQTMGEQLSLSLSYIAHRYPGQAVGALLLVGDGGAMPGLADALSAALDAPARVVGVADLAPGAAGRCGPALVGAFGLAAGAMEDQS